LRILLRVAPRDPTERTKHYATTQPTIGLVRWDDLTQTVARVPRSKRLSYKRKDSPSYKGNNPAQNPDITPRNPCCTRSTLPSYIRSNLALPVRTLLVRNNASWNDLRSLLPDAMLRWRIPISLSPRPISDSKRERRAEIPSLPSTTTSV